MNLAMLGDLHWREPLWLLLALQPLLLLGLRSLWRRRRLAAYADPALQPWVVRKDQRRLRERMLSRDAAYVLAWLLLGVAAAGPRLPLEVPGDDLPGGLDIMLVMDVSRSMTATDVTPNRLRRARLELNELQRRMRTDRLGIIVYAAHPHLYVPLTGDAEAVDFYLQSLDALVLPSHGSEPAAALALARDELSTATRQRAVLLITDGDLGNRTEASRQALASAVTGLNDDGIPLYVLGVGSVEGDAIPLPGGDWLTDAGHPVISRMEEQVLRDLAEAGGGRYSAVADDDSEWVALYDQGMAALAGRDVSEADIERVVWQELYHWALLPALLLLFVSLMPYRLRPAAPTAANFAPVTIAALITMLSLFPAHALQAAASAHQQAHAAYVQGDFTSAAAAYETLPGYAGRLGEGASRYRLADYGGAIRSFSQAMLEASDDRQRAVALYNLGNSYFEMGNYVDAIAAYRDALLYQPDHRAAQQNLAFSETLQREVQRRLERQAATRVGRGPRSARAAESVEIDEFGAVSLDESEAPAATGTEAQQLEPDDRLATLIDRGVEHARLAAGGDAAADGDRALAGDGELTMARRHMERLEDIQPGLWKRVFEMEEGYPAPLETPRELPGVAPW